MQKFITTLLTATLLTTAPAFAEDAPSYADSTLTGNWGGLRDDWAAAGVTTDIVYKFDVMGVASGGLHRGVRTLDNLDVIFGFDGEKLFGSKGTSAVFQLLNNTGAEPDGSLIGSYAIVNNIETVTPTGIVYQAFVQQNWDEDRYSLLAGLYDLNSEFYVNESSLVFLHSTFGIGTEDGQTGGNGPVIFPVTGLAARFAFKPTENTYVMAAVLDAVPGDLGDPRGTQITLSSEEGALLQAEAGYFPEKGKVALGAWRYTQEYDNLLAVDAAGNPVQETNQGFYVIGEHELYAEPNAEGQGLVGFARLGFGSGKVNQVDYSWSTGFTYTGLFTGRDEGQLGLGFHSAHNSNTFDKTGAFDSHESGVELTYADNLTEWLAIQPDVQYIINPGSNPAVDDAVIVGTRFTVNF
jgi:porin